MTRTIETLASNRALQKTLTYGLMHLSVAVLVAFALTRSLTIALSIGLLEPFVQTFFYNIHERLWTKAGQPPVPHHHGLPFEDAGAHKHRVRINESLPSAPGGSENPSHSLNHAFIPF